MKKKVLIFLTIISVSLGIILIFRIKNENNQKEIKKSMVSEANVIKDDFQIDKVLYNEEGRDIHYSVYIPKNVDELDSVSMFITLPGWEGLYFQGVGVNLEYVDFAFTAKKVNENMIILATQLEDWGVQSAEDVISLTKYYQNIYRIDKTYIEGYSGGGETLSLVLNKNSNLYDGALMISSKWNGDYGFLVRQKLPIYFFIGKDDEFNSSNVQQIVIEKWQELLNNTKYKPIDIHTPLWLWSRNGFKKII